MEKGNLQKLRVVFVISPLKQPIYVIFCQDLQIQMEIWKFYENISISEDLSNKEMKIFQVLINIRSIDDLLSMHTTGSNETSLVSEFPSTVNDENVIIAPGQGKKQFPL